MAERKLDIFQLLRAVDQHKLDWFSKQPEDAQKEFAPPVVLRWGSTVEGAQTAAYMLWLVNERVNVHMYTLYKHPDLIFRLLASCGVGSPQKHLWIPMHKRKGGENKAIEFLATLYPEANDREAEMLMGKHDKKSFSNLLQECGIQPDEAKSLLKEYEKLNA